MLFSANFINTMSPINQVYQIKSLDAFFSQHAVFTVDEFKEFLSKHQTTNTNTRKSLLTYHRTHNRIIPIRRGLYAVIPKGSNPDTHPVDPYLIAAKITKDAVLAYHTALEFHGKAYSIYNKIIYTSPVKSTPLRFRTSEFTRTPIPHSLIGKQATMVGVISHNRSGVDILVTNLERTFVDTLDRPEVSGSWEEIWRSLESIEFFDLDQVCEYVNLLDNATTSSKVGFFLEQHQESLMVENRYLEQLQKMKPKQPHYLNRSDRKDCRLFTQWNLLIPKKIINRSWSEVL